LKQGFTNEHDQGGPDQRVQISDNTKTSIHLCLLYRHAVFPQLRWAFSLNLFPKRVVKALELETPYDYRAILAQYTRNCFEDFQPLSLKAKNVVLKSANDCNESSEGRWSKAVCTETGSNVIVSASALDKFAFRSC